MPKYHVAISVNIEAETLPNALRTALNAFEWQDGVEIVNITGHEHIPLHTHWGGGSSHGTLEIDLERAKAKVQSQAQSNQSDEVKPT